MVASVAASLHLTRLAIFFLSTVTRIQAKSMITSNLFVDTSIFRGFGYNFSSRSAEALMEMGRQHELCLLLPEITEKEILRQVQHLASATADSLCAARRKAFTLERHKPWLFETGETNTLVDELKSHLMEDWGEFLGTFRVKRLPCPKIDLNEVLRWWEKYEAPFSRKKSAEFMDAFAASLLCQYQVEHKCDIAVLSQDGDWEGFCNGRDAFHYFSSAAGYAEAFDPNIEAILLLKSVVKSSNLVIDKIRSLISESSFTITIGWDATVHDIEVPSIDFKSVNILDSNFDQANILFCVAAAVEIDLEYNDIAIGEHILETPIRLREQWHSVIEICGSLVACVDSGEGYVTRLLNAQLDTTELLFPDTSHGSET